MTSDLVFENATLVDGTGAPRRTADVVVAGEKIAAVAESLPEEAKRAAKRRVDLRGMVLCPGFVDVHAHGELEPLAESNAAGKVLSGVTTEVSGNCGISPFPLLGRLRQRYEQEARDLFGWEPERLAWTTAGEYFGALEKAGSAIHRAFLVGHGAIRAAIAGYGDGPVAPENQARMRRELEAALDAGCLGLSSGLIYPPGCYAATEELIDLARICARRGALYTTHMRSESDELESAVLETLRIARESGARTQISHLKTSHSRNWHKIGFLEDTLLPARQAGLDFHADRYPYLAGATGLNAVLPSWAFAGGVEDELTRLRDPATSKKLEAEVLAQHPDPECWTRIVVAGAVNAELNPQVAGRSLAEIAKGWSATPFEALRRILIEDRCRTGAMFFSMCEENLARIMSWDFVMIGSDATARDVRGPTRAVHPHPRAFGTFPRVLARYVRETRLLTLEDAVRRMTSLPADAFHLRGRGRVEAGAWADLVVFDPARIQDEATFTDPNRFPTGIEQVYVNGALVAEAGRVLDARPGKVLRREPA
jgi:N-acyl-D-amino-acid deacylase